MLIFQNCNTNIFLSKYVEYLQNTEGWSHKLASPSLCKYFPNIFLRYITKDIFGAGFESYVQLVLSISFTSFQQSAWITTDFLVILLLQQAVFNSYPNINWKWNCYRSKHPNICVWNNSSSRKWLIPCHWYCIRFMICSQGPCLKTTNHPGSVETFFWENKSHSWT